MPAFFPDIGTGATLTTSGTSWSARITEMNWSGISREHVETTHLGSSEARTFLPGDLYDPGELSLSIQYEPGNEPQGLTSATQQEWSLVFALNTAQGQATAASLTALGSVSDFSFGVPLEDVITGDVTMKFSGPITFTSATS